MPSCRSRTIVSADTMNSSMRTIHGPDLHAPGGDEAGQPCLGLGPHLEVVVDHDRLAVEQEALVGRVGLQEVEQVVDEVDELDPVGLERRVPLPVPVRVGDDPHLLTGDLRHAARVRR